MYQKQLNAQKAQLRINLSDFLELDQVISETNMFEKRAYQLLQSYLDENYSIGYQLSVDVLNKLCKQPASTSLSLKERWTQLY